MSIDRQNREYTKFITAIIKNGTMDRDPFFPNKKLDLFDYQYLVKTLNGLFKGVEYSVHEQLEYNDIFQPICLLSEYKKETSQIIEILTDVRNDYFERQSIHKLLRKIDKTPSMRNERFTI